MVTPRKVYVVTRAGRRIEPDNYRLNSEAQARATALYKVLREWDDPDIHKVEVVCTSKPNQVR